ncbi:MAG: GrpB family protein [Gammaproteobacteria bacterium]|nr:GrpB family protein [Gammaproteobacteria bacterium]MDE0193103.1 GrpB family protein [Gammaproteobacteria bacterium]
MRHIREYREDWIGGFAEITGFLEPFLPDGCRVHHIGSTSVPGMPAKDIVDVDVECPQGSMSRVIERLAAAGYEHRGDRGVPTREAFHLRDGSSAAHLRPHHLYACESDSPELRRHLAFRDYLAAHPRRARWLARQKRCADAASPTREAYIAGKAAAYEKILADAVPWAFGRCPAGASNR